MINKIIRFSIKNKLLTGMFIAAWIGWGIYALFHLPMNTLPDLTNNQVKVTTFTPDLATDEVERLITYPLELELGNLPGLLEIRSVSKFGLSDITLVFEEGMGMYKPRQLVKEKLESASNKLPPGVGQPSIGPMTTGLGEIYQYVLSVKPGYDTVYDAMDLRTIQDWIVKKEMINIPGVVGVNTMGGYLKQYEVAVSPDRLQSYNLAIIDIYEALKKNNANTGGSYIEKSRQAYFIRGQGLTQSLEDIRAIGLKNEQGIPLQIGDVATVQYGHAPRFGAFTYNGKGEAVGGKVMMLRGENPAEVIDHVKERLPRVKAALPEGVEMEPFLDRSGLIRETTRTVSENLALGALIVIFVLVLLMGSMRSGLITASVIPLSLLFALGVMYSFGFSANLISLGAIDFGIIIDGAVIIIEFTVFQINRKFSSLRQLKGKALRGRIDRITASASERMMRTAFFGQLIILIVFLPILTLTGQEGDMFRPMAIAFGSALLGAVILCLTYVPMMSALVLRPGKTNRPRLADRILNPVRSGYQRILRKALRYRYAVTTAIVALFIAALFTFSQLGAVFIPQLDEGDFAIHPILPPGTSLSETVEINTKLENILLEEFPDEVDQVATKIGTGEIPTDPMSLEMAKMIITLKSPEEWTRTRSKEELAEMMKEEMSAGVPGVGFFFSQPIEMLFRHLLTGSTADILLNIYGSDLDTLYKYAHRAGALIEDIPGTGDLNVQKVTGLPQIVIAYNRDQLARYGLDIETVNRTIQAGFSGAIAGTVYEGERRFSQVVRLADQHRHNPEAMGELYIRRPNGRQVQLKEVADIDLRTGPASISREGVKRKIEVDINVGDRDTESFVRDVRQQLEEKLGLPRGYNMTYEGDFENLQHAKKRLSWVVPLVLVLIFTLLYLSFGSMKQALLVFSAVPLATIGGVFSLWIRGMPFSISAGIGFIALFGIAVLNGLVLMSFFNELKKEGVNNVFRRIYRGTDMRLRPVILTALTDALGFLPMALSTSPGAEVQRPLATVVVGGLVTATLLTLILLPIIYSFSERRPKAFRLSPAESGRVNRLGRRGKFSVLLLLLIGPLALNTAGQEPEKQTLKITGMRQAVELAWENHPRIKAAELKIEQQQELKKLSWDIPDTKFSYERENEGAGREKWSVEQELKTPMEYIKRNKWAFQQIHESRRSYDRNKAALARDVRLAFTDVLFAKEKADLLKQLETIFGELEKAGNLRYETGDISYLEKVSARAKYNEIRVAKEAALNRLEIVENILASRLFVPGSLLVVPDGLHPLEADNLPDTVRVPGGNPDLALSKSRWRTKKSEGKAVSATAWPDPFLRFSRQELHGNSGFSSFELGVNVPLDILTEKSRSKAAGLAAEQARQNYRQVENAVHTAWKNSLRELETYQKQVHYFQGNRLKEADRIIKSASQQYREGNIDYLQYIQYFDQATGIRLDYLETVRNHNRSIIQLDYLAGTELF